MKKLALVLCILLAFVFPVLADHPSSKLGIGVVGGGGVAGEDVGLALTLPNIPIHWGIHLSINGSVLGLGLTGDYYVIDKTLISAEGFKLDWFLGLGGYASLGFWDSGARFGVGARVPVGLSWHVVKELEIWFDIAPSLGIGINPVQFPDWNVAGDFGIKIWLK